jgi:hypothetical protein
VTIRLQLSKVSNRLHDLVDEYARATESEKRLKNEEMAVRREMELIPVRFTAILLTFNQMLTSFPMLQPEYASRVKQRFAPLEEAIQEQRQTANDIARVEAALAQAEEKIHKESDGMKQKLKEGMLHSASLLAYSQLLLFMFMRVDEEAAHQQRTRLEQATQEYARTVEQTPTFCKVLATDSIKAKAPSNVSFCRSATHFLLASTQLSSDIQRLA